MPACAVAEQSQRDRLLAIFEEFADMGEPYSTPEEFKISYNCAVPEDRPHHMLPYCFSGGPSCFIGPLPPPPPAAAATSTAEAQHEKLRLILALYQQQADDAVPHWLLDGLLAVEAAGAGPIGHAR